jgi:hypothetical protein
MQSFDRFEIRINRSFPPWTLGKGLCVAEIYINNQPLIELVRRVEEPFILIPINAFTGKCFWR